VHAAVVDLHGQVAALVEAPQLRVGGVGPLHERLRATIEHSKTRTDVSVSQCLHVPDW
jgi:hypothetical protein